MEFFIFQITNWWLWFDWKKKIYIYKIVSLKLFLSVKLEKCEMTGLSWPCFSIWLKAIATKENYQATFQPDTFDACDFRVTTVAFFKI